MKHVVAVAAATAAAAVWAVSARTPPPLPTPALHHVGLNVVDPAKSQRFHETIWPEGEMTTLAGLPACKSDMIVLFTKVNRPAPGRFDLKAHRSLQQSPLWHIGFETQTPTTVLRERLKSADATLVPMYSNDKDSGSLWRAGEMGYGRNPIVTAQMMTERVPGKPEEGGYAHDHARGAKVAPAL
jgi:hypothetical protein